MACAQLQAIFISAANSSIGYSGWCRICFGSAFLEVKWLLQDICLVLEACAKVLFTDLIPSVSLIFIIYPLDHI